MDDQEFSEFLESLNGLVALMSNMLVTLMYLAYEQSYYPYGKTETGFLLWASKTIKKQERPYIYEDVWVPREEENILECPAEWSRDESHSES